MTSCSCCCCWFLTQELTGHSWCNYGSCNINKKLYRDHYLFYVGETTWICGFQISLLKDTCTYCGLGIVEAWEITPGSFRYFNVQLWGCAIRNWCQVTVLILFCFIVCLDPRERLKEERDGIVLSPQRRSFGTGCHVTQTSSLGRQVSCPADFKDGADRDRCVWTMCHRN